MTYSTTFPVDDDNDNNMVYTYQSSPVIDGDVAVGTDQSGQGVQVISSMHMDYIHAIALDVYGRRMATCSGDRYVRVWELNDDAIWVLLGQWQAHKGPISSLCWAHPEFGNLLATCGSSDHETKIWEEMTPSSATVVVSPSHQQRNTTSSSNTSGSNNNNNSNNVTHATGTTSSWTQKVTLGEARKAATCCEFSPKHWGLKLAVGSADGCARIYEAIDIMNLTQWPLAATITFHYGGGVLVSGGGGVGTNATSASSISGNMSYNPSSMAGAGITSSNASTASKNIGCTALSWCTGRFEPPTLVVAGIHLVIYRYMETSRSWQAILQLPPPNDNSPIPMSVNNHVLDVSWAPNVGRRFHYIAAAEEGMLRIYKLNRQEAQPDAVENNNNNSNSNTSGTMQQQQQQQQLQHGLTLENYQILPETNAWRCQWNVTGTVLASSGDGGIVQLWKADHHGRFGCVGKVQGDLMSSMMSGDASNVQDANN